MKNNHHLSTDTHSQYIHTNYLSSPCIMQSRYHILRDTFFLLSLLAQKKCHQRILSQDIIHTHTYFLFYFIPPINIQKKFLKKVEKYKSQSKATLKHLFFLIRFQSLQPMPSPRPMPHLTLCFLTKQPI